MVKYVFFNAKRFITGDYDRKYNAEDVNAYFKGAISRDGIYQFVGNQCRVIPAGNMNVAVRDGKGQINYHWFEITANEVLTIRDAHATLNRWTAIVARYDAANRNIYLLTVDGDESERPEKPQMQRTDTLRDICLAYVYVAAGVTEITRDDIIDTVEDIEVCGFVSTLLAGSDGIKKVHQLPIPSATCQGDIYYLIEESKTAGKKYTKGYYYCEPSRTEYDFIDFDWTSDTLANRPVASADYLEILYFANDNNKWYRCVEVSENTYEWQEVTVNAVEELPEPTEDINNQFYIIGNTLYKVVKQESNYKWYMFGTGGGGGHGDFAIIRIEYPEGTEVQVTFDGDTIDAPDTSGVWIYGCDGAGTYIVGIKNTSTTKEVIITETGQVENIFISPQVVNYALLYYLGNEFVDPSEEEKKYSIKTGGWTGSTFQKTISAGNYATAAGYTTALNINTNDFEKIFIKTVTSIRTSTTRFCIGSSYISNPSSWDGTLVNNQILNEQFNSSRTYNLTTYSISSFNAPILITNYQLNHLSNTTYTKNSNNLYAYLKYGNDYVATSTYAIGFVKQDDISGLSDYGTTISEICSNAVSLFDDVSALNWMVLNCTGDFMVTALSNSNFVNAMNTSTNKTILTANEHWARFIALLSV